MKSKTHVWLRRLASWGLGGVFFYAGATKVADPQAFADSIASFRILHVLFITPVALALPMLEIFLGLFLIAGVRRRVCAAMVGLLCLIFAVALAQAWWRGLAVDCGCFGTGEPSEAKTGLALARDVGLGVVACWLWRREHSGSHRAGGEVV